MTLNIKPEFYRNDPELWLANQGGHMALGAATAILVCAFWLFVVGEFPYRIIVFAFLAIGYLVRVELIGQGWQGWDTVEDTVFVILYGSAPVLYAFREVAPGSGDFIGNIWDVVPFLLAAFIHLAIGVGWRVWNRSRLDSE